MKRTKFTACFVSFILIAGFLGMLVAIPQNVSAKFSRTTMWTDSGDLYGTAVGDFDPSNPGNEVVVVGYSYKATMLTHSGTSWTATTMWTDSTRLYDVAVGDFDSFHAGNEVVVVGWSNDVTMLTGSGTSWTATTMWTDSDCLYGVAVGDFDPSNAGNEVVVVGDSYEVTMLTGSGTSWTATTIWTDTSWLNDVAIGDFDPSHTGNEVVVVGDSNKATMLTGSGTSWTATTMWTDSDYLEGVSIGDFDPSYAGNEVVVVGWSNKVTMLTGSGTSWTATTMWADSNNLKRVAAGEFDPSHPGNEIVIVGWSNMATLLTGSGTSWTANTMWTDSSGLLGVAIGNFDSLHSGNEVVVVGATDAATKLAYVDSLGIFISASATTITSGGKVNITLHVRNSTSFMVGAAVELASDSGGAFSVSAGQTDVNGSFSTTFLTPTVAITTTVTLTAKASYTGYTQAESYIQIIVTPSGTPSLTASITATPPSLESGGTTTLDVHITESGGAFENATVYLTDGNAGGSFFQSIGITNANGDFSTTYTAPTVGLITTVTIQCTASYSGYNDGVDTVAVTVNPPPDTTPPSVSITFPLNGQSFSDSMITLEGEATDNIAVSYVKVRIGSGSWQNALGTTSWNLSIILAPGQNTIYAQSFDTSDNPSTIISVEVTYTPSEATVDITYPIDGSTVQGTVYITGEASITSGTIQRIEIRIDDEGWQTAQGVTSWSYEWNTITVQDEAWHNISARAYDGNAYSTVETIKVFVNQSAIINDVPTCTISSPTSGQTVSGEVAISGVASDPDGDLQLERVEIKIGSGSWVTASGTTTWSYNWDTTSVSDGEHTIYARAYDGDVYSLEASLTLTVNNEAVNLAPYCYISSPTMDSTVSGSVTIQGWAYDLDGDTELVWVEIRIDSGSWITVSGTTSWSYNWDTTSVSDGEHRIYARAYDGDMYSSRDSIDVYVENEEEEPSGVQNILDLFVSPICIGLIVLIVIIIVILIFVMSYGRHRRVVKPKGVYESQPPIHGEIDAERPYEGIEDKREIDQLIQGLKDADNNVVINAVLALGKMGEQAVDPLIQALMYEDGRARIGAIKALGKIGDARAVEPLVFALKGGDKEVRMNSAWALGKIGNEKAVEPLIQALKDEESNVRSYSALALGEIGDESAVEPLNQALEDEDEAVKKAAKEALENIEGGE